MPCSRATRATEAPGCSDASTTACLEGQRVMLVRPPQDRRPRYLFEFVPMISFVGTKFGEAHPGSIASYQRQFEQTVAAERLPHKGHGAIRETISNLYLEYDVIAEPQPSSDQNPTHTTDFQSPCIYIGRLWRR